MQQYNKIIYINEGKRAPFGKKRINLRKPRKISERFGIKSSFFARFFLIFTKKIMKIGLT